MMKLLNNTRSNNPKNPKIYKPNTRLIRSLFILKGIKQNELAKELGVTEQYLSYVINGQRKAIQIRKKIAELLNMPYETLWLDKEDK
jgi:transcriptional regulator with XRE-family HTH domain